MLLCGLYFLFPKKYSNIIEFYSKKYDIDKNIIYSIIWTESKFNINAKSQKGAIGLMQILPSTALWCAEKQKLDYNKIDLKDINTNIDIGTYYYKYLYEKYDNFDYAIMAYNAGEGNVDKWIKNNIKTPFLETRDYLKRVKLSLKIYNILNS